MSAPEDEGLQRAASKALLPNIDKIRTFFELSRDMEQVRRMTPLTPIDTAVTRSIIACSRILDCTRYAYTYTYTR